MLRSLLAVSLLVGTHYTHADHTAWQDTPASQARTALPATLSHYRSLQLDKSLLKKQLSHATNSNPAHIALPLPDGRFINVHARPAQTLSNTLAQRFPDIRTWSVSSPDRPALSGVIDLSPYGFHAMLITADGERLFIDPETGGTQTSPAALRTAHLQPHTSFSQRHNAAAFNHNWSCATHDNTLHEQTRTTRQARPEDSGEDDSIAARPGENLRTYRIAIAATAEYTNEHAGGSTTQALSKIVSTLNRINQIYQRDLSIKLQLVSGTEVIYTDPASDPYTNSSAFNMMFENQKNLDNVVGSQNYDIGHVFGTDGGGIATVASACQHPDKAKGVTGLPAAFTGDAFDIDYVAHEIAHQFAATHTFNSTQESCSGGRISKTAYEPGSGSTIMGYASLCGTDNLQTSSLAMFHSKSIEQVTHFAHQGAGLVCGANSTLANNNPAINAGADYTIPAYTAFTLSALSNTDSNGDTLSYSWEQIDAGSASVVDEDTGDNALIRVAGLSASASRTIPRLSDLINNRHTLGEITPATSRTLKFRLQARDGKGGIAHDDIRLNVHDTGSAFAVTKPGKTTILYADTEQSIEWDTAFTEQAPVSCHTVDIALTTNNGKTFTTLETDVPNNGAAVVTLPATLGTTNHIRVKCSNNIFFALSSGRPSRGNVTNDNPEQNNQSGGGSLSTWFIMTLLGLLALRLTRRTTQ